MRIPRRSFLKLAIATGAAAAGAGGGLDVLGRRLRTGTGTRLATRAARTVGTASPRRWVMVVDLARCDGCQECTRACTAMHRVPSGQEWIRVYEMHDETTGLAYWLPRPCMQCDNPPCVKVCPVSATWKREDGIVMQDTSRCIGCRFCIAACPYQARGFNWVEPAATPESTREPYDPEWNRVHFRGTTEKCIFCPALVKEGKLPACVAACPMGALYFGDRGEDAVTNSQGETVRFSALVTEHAASRLLEELGTEPRVYYLPPRRRLYPAPPADPDAGGAATRPVTRPPAHATGAGAPR
ncbi:MAG: 4Fe-4S dicluster domain-containing protein [Firmicutes bacterium]|nr:4Fe-4S dicluster domain-containing protein [Bacillota bacterium]